MSSDLAAFMEELASIRAELIADDLLDEATWPLMLAAILAGMSRLAVENGWSTVLDDIVYLETVYRPLID